MNTPSSTFAVPTPSGIVADGQGGAFGFALFLLGYVYFYFYFFPFTVGGM